MILFSVSEEPVKWQECATSVTEDSIAAAISWVKKMVFEPIVREISCLDALLEAGKDETVSVYPWPAQVTKVALSLTGNTWCLHTADLGLTLDASYGNPSIITNSTCLSFLYSCYGNVP